MTGRDPYLFSVFGGMAMPALMVAGEDMSSVCVVCVCGKVKADQAVLGCVSLLLFSFCFWLCKLFCLPKGNTVARGCSRGRGWLQTVI